LLPHLNPLQRRGLLEFNCFLASSPFFTLSKGEGRVRLNKKSLLVKQDGFYILIGPDRL